MFVGPLGTVAMHREWWEFQKPSSAPSLASPSSYCPCHHLWCIFGVFLFSVASSHKNKNPITSRFGRWRTNTLGGLSDKLTWIINKIFQQYYIDPSLSILNLWNGSSINHRLFENGRTYFMFIHLLLTQLWRTVQPRKLPNYPRIQVNLIFLASCIRWSWYSEHIH